ncbi:MAG: hypothetical protein WCD81_04955 [Candidatus Bathyarchaeia archaeon]
MIKTDRYACSDEVFRDVLRKYRGLLSEYLTLKDRWKFASKAFENSDILPDIFGQGGLDDEIRFFSSQVTRYAGSEENESEQSDSDKMIAIADAKYAIEKIARIVSFIKSGFFQRTDSVELPYIIAGIPFSPERSCGNELYLVAADKLVNNYLSYLNMSGVRWDKFVSWSELQLQQSLPGGRYTLLHKTFHLNLAMDVKYNLQGLLILAHEISHAACQTSFDELGRPRSLAPESVTVLSDTLECIFGLRQKLLEIMGGCNTKLNKNMSFCPFKKWQDTLNAPTPQSFVEYATNKPFTRHLYESLMDIIALRIAGTSYIRAMKDYVFEPAVARVRPDSQRLRWNSRFFTGVLLRISIVLAYVNANSDNSIQKLSSLPREYAEEAASCFSEIENESTSLLKYLLEHKRVEEDIYESHIQCMDCISNAALHIGTRIAENNDRILGGIFKKERNPSFPTDTETMDTLSQNKVTVKAEPRKILDSACKLIRTDQSASSPGALYSLAFNYYQN